MVFTTDVAITDDGTGGNTRGLVAFAIEVDGVKVLRTGPIAFLSKHVTLTVPVEGARLITICVFSLGTNNSDHAALLDAKFLHIFGVHRQSQKGAALRGVHMDLSALARNGKLKNGKDRYISTELKYLHDLDHIQTVERIATSGANLIRVALNWNFDRGNLPEGVKQVVGPDFPHVDNHPFVDSTRLDDYRVWRDATLDLLAEVVDAARNNELKVIVDLHTPPGGGGTITPHSKGPDEKHFRSRNNVAKDGSPIMTLFQTKGVNRLKTARIEKSRAMFVDTWTVIADRFKGNPAIFAYDLQNEPGFEQGDRKLWRSLAKATIRAIVSVDPSATTIVEWRRGTAKMLKPLPRREFPNVIYSYHEYPKNVGHVLLGRINSVEEYQSDHNVPIYVGEFDAKIWYSGRPRDAQAVQQRERVVTELISQFNNRGWMWTWHAATAEDIWPFVQQGFNGVIQGDNPYGSNSTITLENGILAVEGTGDSEGFVIAEVEGMIFVSRAGREYEKQSFSAANITRILVKTNGGDDVIQNTTGLPMEVQEDGAGVSMVVEFPNDKLVSGLGVQVLKRRNEDNILSTPNVYDHQMEDERHRRFGGSDQEEQGQSAGMVDLIRSIPSGGPFNLIDCNGVLAGA